MVWGAINFSGKIQLIIINEILNSDKYIKLLKDEIIPKCFKAYDGNRFFIVQDNAPCHK